MSKKLRKRKEDLNVRNTSHGAANAKTEIKEIPKLFLCISIVTVSFRVVFVEHLKACTHWGTNVAAHCIGTKLLDEPRQVATCSETNIMCHTCARLSVEKWQHEATSKDLSSTLSFCASIYFQLNA
jgi:hypothetical protein